ncbi:MAG: ABC transporter ATP-binding protein [Bauldia sp.]|nr:ABC transporter ATP-binding protein [Bauldia sp.]
MLGVKDLTVAVGPDSNAVEIVSGVSFSIGKGEVLGLVGESGCGKSMTSLAIMGLLPDPGPRVRAGRIELDGVDVTNLAPWRRVEAGHGNIAMIFQEPMTSLNPVVRIDEQIAEAVRVHDGLSGAAARERARALLEMVRIPDAALQRGAYPHQLSGGMRQRVMIAIALACRPHILIADEPTTALDVTVQFQILGLLRELCDRLDMAMLFITHDLGVVAQLVDRVAVMYAGRLVETATVQTLFGAPAHPYTRALMACMPAPGRRAHRLTTIPGQAPQPGGVPIGCAFAPRCPDVRSICRADPLTRATIAEGHEALCKFPVSGSAA